MSKPVRFDSLEFLLNVAKIYATDVAFIFDIVFALGDYLSSRCFLPSSVPSSSSYLSLRIMATKRKTYFSSLFLIIVYTDQICKRESWPIICRFTQCAFKFGSDLLTEPDRGIQ